MCKKIRIIFGYLTVRKVQIISNNDPQVIIYMSVSMPIHRPDHTYTVNRTCRVYMDAESLYGNMCVVQCLL